MRVFAALAVVVALAAAPGDGVQRPPAEYPRTWQPAAVLSPERAAVVVVRVEGRGGGEFADGTGVAIAPDLILTADHLLGEPALFVIRCDTELVEVRQVTRDEEHDVAVLQVDGAPLVPVELAPSDPQPGAELVVSGYPRGQDLVVLPGRAESYVDGSFLDAVGTVMRFTPAPEPGQSGGALLDAHGRLAGLVTGVERASGVGYAVPASVLRAAVGTLVPGRRIDAGTVAAPAARPRQPACRSEASH